MSDIDLKIARKRIKMLEFALTEIMALSDNVDIHNIITSVLQYQERDDDNGTGRREDW